MLNSTVIKSDRYSVVARLLSTPAGIPARIAQPINDRFRQKYFALFPRIIILLSSMH